MYIRCCGNGGLWLRPYGVSLLEKSPKSNQKGSCPNTRHLASGSVCPPADLNPWAAATRHPWRGAANPASCRVTHGFKPAFGQRVLTGRLRSRSRSKSTAQRPDSRLEWLKLIKSAEQKQKQTQSRCKSRAESAFLWELACLRLHQLCLTDVPSHPHRRQASPYTYLPLIQPLRSATRPPCCRF